ncbi:MAG: Snf7 [Phormidium sp. OSCR]|nr:MAG: Snf7 [Phormidium sp. OSCR]
MADLTPSPQPQTCSALALPLVRQAYLPPPERALVHQHLPLPPRPRKMVINAEKDENRTPAWCYALGTSAGVTAVLLASQYYGQQLFNAEPNRDFPPLPQDLAQADPDTPLTPTTVAPEVWGQLAQQELDLWKQDLTTFAQEIQARVQPQPRNSTTPADSATPPQPSSDQQAQHLLQQAFNRAEKRDFASAITLLQQIPAHTQVSDLAQSKLIEYQQKRNTQADYWLYRAKFLAYGQDFAGAIGYLRQIPPETRAYREAQQRLANYRQAREDQAQDLLQQAAHFAQQGNFATANRLLRLIPQEAAAYGTAKSHLIDYSRQLYLARQNDRSQS